MSTGNVGSDGRWNRVGVLTLAVATVAVAVAVGVGLTRPTEAIVDAEPVVAFVAPAPAKVVVIGDSYTQGTPQGGNGDASWASLSWRQLRNEGAQIAPTVEASGGSGYVTAGTADTNFADNVNSAVSADDDVVIVFGGSNDVTVPSDVEARAIRGTLAMIRKKAPRARLIVVGPVQPGAEDDPDLIAVSQAIRREADVAGATFVDPIAERWFVDDPELIGEDGVHPTDAGHRAMADHLLPVLRAVLARQSVTAGG